jgi:CHASE2 domain-containing sensor protein
MLIFGTVGAVAVALTLVVYAGHVLRSLELKTVDTRFVLRGSQGAPSDVAVVQIDDVTFNDLRNSNRPAQWPFSRCYHASVIDQIAKAAPRAIAVDIQFTEPSSSAACDNKLIEAVGRAGNVVLATTEVDAHGHTGSLARGPVTRSSLLTRTASSATCRGRPRGSRASASSRRRSRTRRA